jgi:hypothetical protein
MDRQHDRQAEQAPKSSGMSERHEGNDEGLNPNDEGMSKLEY